MLLVGKLALEEMLVLLLEVIGGGGNGSVGINSMAQGR